MGRHQYLLSPRCQVLWYGHHSPWGSCCASGAPGTGSRACCGRGQLGCAHSAADPSPWWSGPASSAGTWAFSAQHDVLQAVQGTGIKMKQRGRGKKRKWALLVLRKSSRFVNLLGNTLYSSALRGEERVTWRREPQACLLQQSQLCCSVSGWTKFLMLLSHHFSPSFLGLNFFEGQLWSFYFHFNGRNWSSR